MLMRSEVCFMMARNLKLSGDYYKTHLVNSFYYLCVSVLTMQLQVIMTVMNLIAMMTFKQKEVTMVASRTSKAPRSL